MLPKTQQALIKELIELPVIISTGQNLSSIMVVIPGDFSGPTVLLRADMDALPVEEKTQLPFASTNGAMHACGHDLHMAALVGSIRILASRKHEIHGTVLAIFQPGEEGHGGAKAMLTEGVLETAGDRPIASYGLHVFSFMPRGQFFCREGVVMGGTLNFEIEIVGTGGHAARPYAAENPIIAGSIIVQAIQSYVAQKTQPSNPIVATVGAFSGGTAANVIPDKATLRISLRALSESSIEKLYSEIVELASSVARGYGLETSVRSGSVMIPTVSSAIDSKLVQATAIEHFGKERFTELVHPEMIAEDFSYFLEETGGAFLFLGAAIPGEDSSLNASNHSPMAQFDDSVIDDAALLLAELAIRRLSL